MFIVSVNVVDVVETMHVQYRLEETNSNEATADNNPFCMLRNLSFTTMSFIRFVCTVWDEVTPWI